MNLYDLHSHYNGNPSLNVYQFKKGKSGGGAREVIGYEQNGHVHFITRFQNQGPVNTNSIAPRDHFLVKARKCQQEDLTKILGPVNQPQR